MPSEAARSRCGLHVTAAPGRQTVETGPPPERRRALIVANARYDDEGLERLASPGQDATALRRVLDDPVRCGFVVSTVVDGGSSEVAEAVEEFLVDAER